MFLHEQCQTPILLLLFLFGNLYFLVPSIEAEARYSLMNQLASNYDYNENEPALTGENYEVRVMSRSRRSAPVLVPWIQKLTASQMAAFRTGWAAYGESCNFKLHSDANDYFLLHDNTTETVHNFLTGDLSKNKSQICDFTAGFFCNSWFGNKCACRLRMTHVAGQCQVLEGGFDCGTGWYDSDTMDLVATDNRAGLLQPWNCVAGSTCKQLDYLRADEDSEERVMVCKPDTPGNFPETKRWLKELVEIVEGGIKFIPRNGSSCKIHLNTHSSVSPHYYVKEIFMRNLMAGFTEAPHNRCNLLKHEECDREEKECVCNFGFGEEEGECRLSGSSELDEATVRRCEWDLFPYYASQILLEAEGFVPDKVEVTCMTNATCRLNTDGKFKSCQCEPGKVCPLPERRKSKNGVQPQPCSLCYSIIFMLIAIHSIGSIFP